MDTPHLQRMVELLRRLGTATAPQIADELDLPYNVVRMVLMQTPLVFDADRSRATYRWSLREKAK